MRTQAKRVCAAWLAGKASNRKSDSLTTDGAVLWTYDMPLAIVIPIRDGESYADRHVAMIVRYADMPSATSKSHQRDAAWSLSECEVTTIEVPLTTIKEFERTRDEATRRVMWDAMQESAVRS